MASRAERNVHYPKKIPAELAAKVGFAPAVRVGDFVYVSALSGIYVDGDKIAIAEGGAGQCAQILEHLGEILTAAGGSLDDVVDLTILVRPDVTDQQVLDIGRALGKGFKPGRHADTWLRA